MKGYFEDSTDASTFSERNKRRISYNSYRTTVKCPLRGQVFMHIWLNICIHCDVKSYKNWENVKKTSFHGDRITFMLS